MSNVGNAHLGQAQSPSPSITHFFDFRRKTEDALVKGWGEVGVDFGHGPMSLVGIGTHHARKSAPGPKPRGA